jgi:hypothetical protein
VERERSRDQRNAKVEEDQVETKTGAMRKRKTDVDVNDRMAQERSSRSDQGLDGVKMVCKGTCKSHGGRAKPEVPRACTSTTASLLLIDDDDDDYDNKSG